MIAYVFVVQLELFALSHWPRYKIYKQKYREGENTEKKGTDVGFDQAGSLKMWKTDFLNVCSDPNFLKLFYINFKCIH